MVCVYSTHNLILRATLIGPAVVVYTHSVHSKLSLDCVENASIHARLDQENSSSVERTLVYSERTLERELY